MKLHLTAEELEKAEELAKNCASRIIDESKQDNKEPVLEMLNNLADLASFFVLFLRKTGTEPSNKFLTGYLMGEIRECTSGRVEEVLYLLKAIEVYTGVITLMDSDILPFAVFVR